MEYVLILRWLLIVLALGAVGLPMSAALFRRFPGQGAALALPCSLVLLTVTAYWVGHLRFGWLAPLIGVLAVGIVSGLAIRADVDLEFKAYAGAAVVFTVAFLVIVAVRAVTPGIVPAGGEKFLDYALLNAVLRAPVLPPEDPWFAGEPVRYYYGAQLRAALLVRLTGTPPRFGYNLALASAFATLVVTAYGLSGALADARGHSARIGGLFGAFLVGFAGNLATPVRALFGLLPHDLALQYGRGVFTGIRAPYEVAVHEGTTVNPFSFWYARYVLEGTLTPFPLWAFYNGDLNAYMLATPLLLLVAALCFAYYRTPASECNRRRLLVFVAVPLVGGILTVTSMWSLPTTVGLVWLAFLFAPSDPVTLLPNGIATRFSDRDVHSGSLNLRAEGRRILVATGLAGGTGFLVATVASPFLLFHTPVSRGIGFLPPRSDLIPLLLVWGVFLAAFTLFFWPRVRARVTDRTATVGALIYILLSGYLLALDLAAVLLLGPFLFGAWLLLRLDADVGYETVLVIAGAGLFLAVEFAYARVWPFDPNAPRWNTVYKVAMQVWVLWGVAAAVAFTDVLDRMLQALPDFNRALDVGPEHVRPVLTVGIVTVLLMGSATFGALTLGGHFNQTLDDEPEPLTLDGTAYIEAYHPAEAAAIDWLDRRPGTPTIVTKPGTVTYTWVNAPSTMTGIPTVLGWAHEKGYRGLEVYQNRRIDIEVLYRSQDPQSVRILLDKYDIRYVYVGPNERQAYAGEQNFSSVNGLNIAYRNQNVTIYRVNTSIVDP